MLLAAGSDFSLTIDDTKVPLIQTSVSLKYEPSSEPLHIFVK